jgi:RNA polymerase sigma-70 factor (ECF subfamily)
MRELRRAVRRAAGGDEDAGALLFDTYYPRVFRYALAKLRHIADAEDVAAETFAKVLGGLDGFRWKGGGFEAWLFRIAANLVVDRARGREREQATEELPLASGIEEWTPEAGVLAGEQATELHGLLQRLPPEQKEVLLLRFAAGLDTNETGAVMGKKPNAVRQLQHRALEGLRRMMPQEVGARWE